MNDRFIREPECLATTGLSRTTRWRLERRGLFPKRKKISQNTIGWLESEILSWLRSKANVDEDDPEEDAEAIIDYVRRAHLDYTPFSFWDDKDVYIQALVEKIDLKSLFAPIFGKFHIPFANARGWSDIHRLIDGRWYATSRGIGTIIDQMLDRYLALPDEVVDATGARDFLLDPIRGVRR